MKIIVLGLSLSSSWGNGHATTYRALLEALAPRHDLLFLERDQPWYAQNRDLPQPDYCDLAFYQSLTDLTTHRAAIEAADAVMIGSYVPEAAAITCMIRPWITGILAFYDIDTPITLRLLTEGAADYLSPSSIRLFDLYFSFTGGPVLNRLEQEFGARRAVALYCSVDPDRYHPLSADLRWDLGYLGTYSADRQPALERLLLEPARRAPEKRFVVAGPQYPTTIDWPANVERIDHLPPADHVEFYNAQRFTLNITRADMIAAGYSPSVRLFEATACATPVISDDWPGLDRFFDPGSEIIIAHSGNDSLAALALPDHQRQAIGAAGRARCLAGHTAQHRARTLEAALSDHRIRQPTRMLAGVQ